MDNYQKTLAELKRYLQPGVKLKMVKNLSTNKLIGITRAIKKAQTNAIQFEPVDGKGQGSWLEYGKARDYVFSSTGFTVVNEWDNNSLLEYHYILD